MLWEVLETSEVLGERGAWIRTEQSSWTRVCDAKLNCECSDVAKQTRFGFVLLNGRQQTQRERTESFVGGTQKEPGPTFLP